MSERQSDGGWILWIAFAALALGLTVYYLRFARRSAPHDFDNPPAVSDRSRPVALPPGVRPMDGDVALPDASKPSSAVPFRKKKLDAPPSPTKD